jgi:hypothetical protein
VSRIIPLTRFSHRASGALVTAAIQFFVDTPQLMFRPLPLIAITGVSKARAKLLLSRLKPLTSLPIPALWGWDGGDAGYLQLNGFGMSRRQGEDYGGTSRCYQYGCGKDENKR